MINCNFRTELMFQVPKPAGNILQLSRNFFIDITKSISNPGDRNQRKLIKPCDRIFSHFDIEKVDENINDR